MRLDPMFPRLADFVPQQGTVIDLGCGYGVPAAWLLALRPSLRFHSFEPDQERARTAALVLGDAAVVTAAPAQELSGAPQAADAAMMLDMAHYLSDAELDALLQKLHGKLRPSGRLIIRVTIPGPGPGPIFRRWETRNMARHGLIPHFRTREEWAGLLDAAGFDLELCEPTATGREEHWFIARPGSAV